MSAFESPAFDELARHTDVQRHGIASRSATQNLALGGYEHAEWTALFDEAVDAGPEEGESYTQFYANAIQKLLGFMPIGSDRLDRVVGYFERRLSSLATFEGVFEQTKSAENPVITAVDTNNPQGGLRLEAIALDPSSSLELVHDFTNEAGSSKFRSLPNGGGYHTFSDAVSRAMNGERTLRHFGTHFLATNVRAQGIDKYGDGITITSSGLRIDQYLKGDRQLLVSGDAFTMLQGMYRRESHLAEAVSGRDGVELFSGQTPLDLVREMAELSDDSEATAITVLELAQAMRGAGLTDLLEDADFSYTQMQNIKKSLHAILNGRHLRVQGHDRFTISDITAEDGSQPRKRFTAEDLSLAYKMATPRFEDAMTRRDAQQLLLQRTTEWRRAPSYSLG